MMRGQAPFWIDPDDHSYQFPDASLALAEPDGLLAIGGSLHPQRLLSAYANGIFPWYNKDQPILWWSPNPRAVLYPEKFIASRSLRKIINKAQFQISADREFEQIIIQCAQPRHYERNTWITDEMLQAYVTLHQLGYAHSVECRRDGRLVGGLYGVAIGKVFFGESMFSRESNASKVALYYLSRKLLDWGYHLIDCQVSSPHLISLGAELMPREKFLHLLKQCCPLEHASGRWQFHIDNTTHD